MKKRYYGGQAVMEGVMMQGPEGKAIACRLANGELAYKISSKKPLKDRYPILGWPVIRGCISFAESMINGVQDLTWSAAQAGESESEKLTAKEIVFAVVFAFVIAIGFFVVIPVFLANPIRAVFGDFGRSLFESLLRISFFVIYIIFISRMEDIRRLFAYHGAEHKTISTYEAGEALTVENARRHSTIHPRCGTSFLLMAMILMIVIFTFVGQTDPVHRILIKVCCMPLVAGLSYELFRLPLKFPHSRLVGILVTPGLWMQHLTTKEPDDSQLEVAIASLQAVPGFVPNNVPEDQPEKVSASGIEKAKPAEA